MQKSSHDGKPVSVVEAAARLKQAREMFGFDTAVAAADAMGIPRSTYVQHESGIRPYPYKRAILYGAALGVQPEWLLFGAASLPAQGSRVPIVATLGRVLAASASPPEADWVWVPDDVFSPSSLTAVWADMSYASSWLAFGDRAIVIAAKAELTGIAVADLTLFKRPVDEGQFVYELAVAIPPPDGLPGLRLDLVGSDREVYIADPASSAIGVVTWVITDALERRRTQWLLPPPLIAMRQARMRIA